MHEFPQPWSGTQELRRPRRRAGALRRVVSTPGGALGLAISAVIIAVHDLAETGRLSMPDAYAWAWLFSLLLFAVGWRFFC